MAKKAKQSAKAAVSKGIPEDVKAQVAAIVNQFNEKLSPHQAYSTRYKSNHLYLDRCDGPVCRLTYAGDITDWEFAIYKFSSERYDADEWMFPGSEHLDGTILGALKAVLEAYP